MIKTLVPVLVFTGILLVGASLTAASEIDKGKDLFEKKQCSLCHMIEGKGGKVASDLSSIGNKRDAEWLMKFFENPKKVANAKMMPVKGTPEELSALAAYLLSHK